RNIWTLSFDQVDRFFLAFYINQALYYVSLALIKASILFMFLRIFPGDKVRMLLWSTQVFNLLTCLAFLFVGVFQCQPLSLAWEFWSRDRPGHCVNVPNVALSHGGLNVALDVWMLILPAVQIWSLNMKLREKLGVMSMFCLGFFLTFVSAFRIHALIVYTLKTTNPTVASLPTAVWSDIELYVGVFTACIPSMRQFFERITTENPVDAKRIQIQSKPGSPDEKCSISFHTGTQIDL
ncbi:CFEM domain-containing protein, partial [Colletotrichum incanum]